MLTKIWGSDDFTMQKVYLLRLMRIGLMLVSFIALRAVGAVLVVFIRRWRQNFEKSSSQWEARADT
jgi:hypothetical protein